MLCYLYAIWKWLVQSAYNLDKHCPYIFWKSPNFFIKSGTWINSEEVQLGSCTQKIQGVASVIKKADGASMRVSTRVLQQYTKGYEKYIYQTKVLKNATQNWPHKTCSIGYVWLIFFCTNLTLNNLHKIKQVLDELVSR